MGLGITVDAIDYQFHNRKQAVTLFQNLSLDIEVGDFISITGPSGTGKSSLLALLAGLDRPSRGAIQYRDAGGPVTAQSARQRMGFVFQQFHLLEELNTLENIALPLTIQGKRRAKQEAQEWLQRIGLEDRGNAHINQLSGGEQQRVAIARALINRPGLIFADEPTGNLDSESASSVCSLLVDAVRFYGASLLVVTHNADVAALADRQLSLSHGHLQESRASC